MVCKKSFYISKSRFAYKKFCSKKCAFIDQKSKSKNKKCVICKSNFTVKGLSRYTRTTCSTDCHKNLASQITKRSMENKKHIVVSRNCRFCKKKFDGQALYITSFCSIECYRKNLSISRVNKGNPNYRGGLWSKDGEYKNVIWGYSKTAKKHMLACQRYRRHFLKEHGYLFCEVCKINQSIQFSTHHIYYASRFPKHPKLHDFRNLIMVCLPCHTKFHASKYKDLFTKLENERSLKKLFS